MAFKIPSNVSSNHPAYSHVLKRELAGAGLGAAFGGWLGGRKHEVSGISGKPRQATKKERIIMGTLEGLSFGALGHSIGAATGANSWNKKVRSGWTPPPVKSQVPKDFRHIKTQAQAKKYKREIARKLHPDMNPGVSPQKMQDFNSKWDEFEKHHLPHMPKEAQVRYLAFTDELRRIFEA